MNRITVRVYRSTTNRAVLVAYVSRFAERHSPASYRLIVGEVSVVHFDRNIPNAIPMTPDVLGCHLGAGERGTQNKVRFALLQGVRRKLAVAGLKAAVGNLREAESVAVKERGLPRIPDPELHMVNPLKFQRVLHPMFHLASLSDR
jgi:hypothetical protein